MTDEQQPYGYQPPPGYAQPYGYPGQVATGLYTDAETGLVLPDGTELASAGRRIGGFFLEILLAIVTLYIGYIIWTLIVWARGQTPGKQVLGMRVWRTEQGRPANWGYMFLRQLINGVLYGLAYIGFIVSGFMLVLRKDHRTPADLAIGSVVLHDPNKVLRHR